MQERGEREADDPRAPKVDARCFFLVTDTSAGAGEGLGSASPRRTETLAERRQFNLEGWTAFWAGGGSRP